MRLLPCAWFFLHYYKSHHRESLHPPASCLTFESIQNRQGSAYAGGKCS